jgi:hypothetical protein
LTNSVEWDQLPAAVRAAVQQHTGPVTGARLGGQGVSTMARLILHTAAGDVFIKGTSPDADDLQRGRLALGAALAPHVTALSPPLLFRVQADGWDITGWPALPGRPWADLNPESADIPKLAALLAELGTMPAPDVPIRSIRTDWGYFADDPGLLDGNMLVHTDPHRTNFVVNGNRAWLVDWGWAKRGPAWMTAALLVLSLMEAGWKPADAEQALTPVPAWAEAPPSAVSAFAVTNTRSWERAYKRRPDNEAHRSRLHLARQWEDHRAALTP